MASKLKTETEIGIRIDTLVEQKHEKGPMVIRFVYMLDTLKFKKWVESHEHLMEGYAAMFSVKGINVWFVGKAGSKDGKVNWEQAAFCLGDKDKYDTNIPIRIQHKEVVFVVHRNPISSKEWNVFLPDVIAAQSRKNEG